MSTAGIAPALLTGLATSFGLIVAIGAQNLYVLRQGIRRDRIGLVIAVCAGSDAILMTAGVAGLGATITAVPWLLVVVKWAGAAFLTFYAFLAARRAIRGGQSLEPGDAGPGIATDSKPAPRGSDDAQPRTLARSGAAGVFATVVALTWLNPHVYLDTVVLLGSIGGSFGAARWWFLLGAVSASILWFLALGYGARLLGRWLRTERAWRILDGTIALVMRAIAISLLVT